MYFYKSTWIDCFGERETTYGIAPGHTYKEAVDNFFQYYSDPIESVTFIQWHTDRCQDIDKDIWDLLVERSKVIPLDIIGEK